MKLKDRLAAIVRPAPTAVNVKTLGGKVYLRELTGEELDELVASRGPDGQLSRKQIVFRTLCDEQGNPEFEEGDEEGKALVGRLPTRDLQKLFAVARKINGLGKDEDSPTDAD